LRACIWQRAYGKLVDCIQCVMLQLLPESMTRCLAALNKLLRCVGQDEWFVLRLF